MHIHQCAQVQDNLDTSVQKNVAHWCGEAAII